MPPLSTPRKPGGKRTGCTPPCRPPMSPSAAVGRPREAREGRTNKKPFRLADTACPPRTKGHAFRGTTSIRRALLRRRALRPGLRRGCPDHHQGLAVTGLPVPVYSRTGCCSQRASAGLPATPHPIRFLWQCCSGRRSAVGICGGFQPVAAPFLSAPKRMCCIRTPTLPGWIGVRLSTVYRFSAVLSSLFSRQSPSPVRCTGDAALPQSALHLPRQV